MKTGRNELCPCGSGKKYKKCCINTEIDQVKTQPVIIPGDLSIPDCNGFRVNPFLWATFHLNSMYPEECTCDDCADAQAGCPKNFNPKHCSETCLMSEPEIF